MNPPDLTFLDKIKSHIANIAWRVFLWASNTTEAELQAELYENAINEYKSEKANNWISK